MKIITNYGKAISIKDSFIVVSNNGTTFEISSTESHLYIKKVTKKAEDVSIKIVPVCSKVIKLR